MCWRPTCTRATTCRTRAAPPWTGSPSAPPTPAPAPLPAGAFAPIDTGEPVPEGFDAVVPVEVAELVGDGLAITGRVTAGDHVRPGRGGHRAGAVVLRAGAVLDPYAIGVAAGAGHATLAVRRRPRVAVLATGDEIRPAGRTLAPGETADANGPMLAALATVAGADVTAIRRASTTPSCSRGPPRCVAEADLVLVIAGSSRGRRDRTPAIIEELGDVVRARRTGAPRAPGAAWAASAPCRWCSCPAIPSPPRSPSRCSPSRCSPMLAGRAARRGDAAGAPRPRHRLAPRRRHGRAGLARSRRRRS